VYEFAARGADLVYITPHDLDQARSIVEQVRTAERAVGRGGEPLRVYADIVVYVDDEPGEAAVRKVRLDALDASGGSDAFVFTGTPDRLAELLLSWQTAGIEGFRLRPGALPHDLDVIVNGLVPSLQARGAFRTSYAEVTLRERLGLPLVANRYAAQGA
jgi:alkanesulfonate monooxygenase SsuD/methylene tetrahydromethanopterin reductase-like flavin-dependent oxidoreductase (luciferase family)